MYYSGFYSSGFVVNIMHCANSGKGKNKSLTTSRMISCLASSSDWMARFSLLSTNTRSCSFSNRRRTFFMLSQPTPWPSRTLCTTSFKNCWFSLNQNTVSVIFNRFSIIKCMCYDNMLLSFMLQGRSCAFERMNYLVLLTRPWGEGDSLFTVGLCLITEDFWSTSARGARAPGISTDNNEVSEHHRAR